MLVATAVGPSLADLRPLKPPVDRTNGPGRFPIHPDLVDRLVDAESGGDPVDGDGPTGPPDPVIAHALAVCSTYSYSQVAGFCEEPDTIARMMARLGMPENRTLMAAERVDPSFIVSSGFVIQSQDGRAAILCYRGTEPFNVASWLTDADLSSEQLTIAVGDEHLTVHPGFYRNVRATRSVMVQALDRACRGRSILSEDEAVPNRLEALYVTGHSLGGAMAVLMSLLLLNDPDYAELCRPLRRVYTYGQPMVGAGDLADSVTALGQDDRFCRFVYRRDVVPHLPPRGLGSFAHFGREYRVADRGRGWQEADHASRQSPFWSVAMAPVEFISRSIPLARWLWFPYSLSDHLPLRYVQWLAPELVASEYGDYAASLGRPPRRSAEPSGSTDRNLDLDLRDHVPDR